MAKKPWYAWRDAEGNGDICKTWDECQKACSGKHNEKHQGFRNYEEAWAFAHPDQPVSSQQTGNPASAFTAPVCSLNMKTVASKDLPPWETENQPLPEIPQATSEIKQQVPEILFSPNTVTQVHLDISRAEKGPISEQVIQFCDKYNLDKLSIDQKRAVEAVQGKYLLFAVPGSGKTTVLIARTGYLIYSCGIHPKQLMTMTFTRASAQEMRDRYCKCFNPTENQIPDFRTIHSFCFSIVIPMLRRAGFVCPFHVVNEDIREKTQKKKYTQRAILTAVLKKHLDSKASDETAQETVQTAFSSIKNREMAESEYSRFCVKIDRAKYPLGPMYEDYQKYLEKLNCMDFDDMLIYAKKGLEEYPKVLRSLQDTYHYWSIDEAQDNSKIQHELMSLLAGPKGNLFMVGDDDQSIYGFRGAEPGMLLEFGNRPDVHLLVMGTNYRSGCSIVNTSKSFVEVNECRADKNMNASHSWPGEIFIPPSFPTEAQQYDYILSMISESIHQGKKLGVLYQLNISALPLIVRLHKASIPFEASRGLGELLHRKTIGNLLQILRFSQKPCNPEEFQACKKALGLYWITEELMNELKSLHARYKQKPLLQIMLDSFEEENERSRRTARIHETLMALRDKSPSEAMIRLLSSPDLAPPNEILTDRLATYALLSICDLYTSIPEMLQELAEMEKAEKQKNPDIPEEEQVEEDQSVVTEGKTLITLSTIHSAKGREWNHVILIDSFQETFPGEPQFDRIGYDPEEARRVFYVAVTRAIKRLDILTVGKWHGNTEKVSSFISEFAWIADMQSKEAITEKEPPKNRESDSSVYVLTPSVFYGVPVGRIPGVYTNWSDVQAQTQNFSIPAGKQQKKFLTFEEAWEYAFPGKPVPVREPSLVTDTISRAFQLSGGATFNMPMDLPAEVRNTLLEHFGVRSLHELSEERITRLKNECDLFSKGNPVDYHGHTDGYALVYLPVNLYKVWLPLWKLLSSGKLPLTANVLELGPGPGTASWGMIDFYRTLARDNTDKQFSLLYTAVEREPDFSRIFSSIQEKICSNLPGNMTVHMNLSTGTDAFDYILSRQQNNLDLILESNMLNKAENAGDRETQVYLTGLHQNLKPGGHAIFIEPGKNESINYLNAATRIAENIHNFSALEEATKSAVFLGENTLALQAIEIGLRYTHKMKHWFSYLILEQKGDAV